MADSLLFVIWMIPVVVVASFTVAVIVAAGSIFLDKLKQKEAVMKKVSNEQPDFRPRLEKGMTVEVYKEQDFSGRPIMWARIVDVYFDINEGHLADIVDFDGCLHRRCFVEYMKAVHLAPFRRQLFRIVA